MEAEEAKEKAFGLEHEMVLADGTMDENFTKSRAKVTMPEKTKAKKPTQAAGAVGSIVFALFFNVLLFCRRAADFDEYFVHRARLGDCAGSGRKSYLLANVQSVYLGNQTRFVDRF